MDETTRDDIRKLIKTFGVQADAAILQHLQIMGSDQSLRLRLVLEDLTDYGDTRPPRDLRIEVEGEIKR